jgi:hypothetical protein
MDIPNLSNNQLPEIKTPLFSLPVLLIIITIAIATGFWLSRISPNTTGTNNLVSQQKNNTEETALSTDNISTGDQLKVGKLYGNTEKNFKDTATGTIEKGSINGEGTHILNREGGKTQRASLTSSAVDLDLFVGKKVEVKGETNSSTKTAWLMDVGSIKILE